MLPILARLKSWRLTRLLNYVGLHQVMTFRGTWLPLKSSSLVVSIVHKGEADFIQSGRLLQRFWVHANQAGLSMQALGVMPLFFARLHFAQGLGFTAEQIEKLTKVEEDFASITPGYRKDVDQLIMLFRLGYVKTPVARSFRRSVESFIM